MTMSMETLTSSLGSLVEESLYATGEMESDDLLRRLSPYATLRPGDLTMLLGNQRGPSSDHTHRKWASSLFDNAIVERSSDSEGESDKEAEEDLQERDLVVRGQDVPAEYVVRGLRRNEMPVIGVFVDPRIVPGFHYTIRRLGTSRDSFLFGGRALRLQSVGLGYGKRLTFAGDSFNFNTNYFWSDSDPNGFAFSLAAVEPSQVLTVYSSDGSGIVGEVKVNRVLGVQEELSSEVVEGDIIKRCQVALQCQVTYFQSRHRCIDVKLHDFERMTGQAVVIKKKKSRVAALDCIEGVALAGVSGSCTLQASEP